MITDHLILTIISVGWSNRKDQSLLLGKVKKSNSQRPHLFPLVCRSVFAGGGGEDLDFGFRGPVGHLNCHPITKPKMKTICNKYSN